jgi:transposase-like protein
MKKYTPEQKAQALKLLEQDGATSASVARTMGIPSGTVRRWASEKATAPSNVLSIEEMRERAQRAVEATPTAKLRLSKNHFTEKQYELLNRHATDLQALRNKALQATIQGDAVMMKATASLIAVMIHAQKHEREIYNIKPGTEHEILKLGMNQQKQ